MTVENFKFDENWGEENLWRKFLQIKLISLSCLTYIISHMYIHSFYNELFFVWYKLSHCLITLINIIYFTHNLRFYLNISLQVNYTVADSFKSCSSCIAGQLALMLSKHPLKASSVRVLAPLKLFAHYLEFVVAELYGCMIDIIYTYLWLYSVVACV